MVALDESAGRASSEDAAALVDVAKAEEVVMASPSVTLLSKVRTCMVMMMRVEVQDEESTVNLSE